ncbi:hypothetical protein MPSEU_000837300 [Mayamaea pseudoterrestris]|nr:hypothetical protein MPSEU_000837300 [Mayamaea pseudoterrestris]
MNLKPFLSWCASKGISSCLQIKNIDDDYRYAIWNANHPIDRSLPQIQLFQCPLEACIIASSSQELADRLLMEVEMGEDSMYAEYLKVLPSMDWFKETLPRFWSKDRLKSVTDSGCLLQALRDDEARVQSARDQWSLAVVDTRSHFLPDRKYSLTPLLDMINHDPHVETKMNFTDGQLLLYVNTDAVPEPAATSFLSKLFKSNPSNQQVCIKYGDFTNLYSLYQYGFVVPDNPHNTEVLFVSLLRQPTLRVRIQADGRTDTLSLGMLRRTLATSDELKLIKGSPAMVPFLSRRNELEVYAVIVGSLEDAFGDAKSGAEAARFAKDDLVDTYLTERAKTLKRGLKRIEREYPQLFE